MSAEQASTHSAADTRSLILDATEAIMLEEGYAGVSSRKVAARAGLKSNLLHYYFKTMDDLFISAFRRREDQHFARFAGAAASGTPLRDLWNLGVDAASSKLYLEFNALASHRLAVRDVITRSNGRDRISMAAALQSVFQQYGIDPARFPPKAVATAMAGMARVFATDRALGTSEGHAEAFDLVERLLRCVESPPHSPGTVIPESGESVGEHDVVDQ